MRHQIVVVGGGLAGSMAACVLGRAGHSVILIDPHEIYPPDFRCEKIEAGHMDVLRRSGLAESVIGAATHTDRLWIARFGRLVDKTPFEQYGMAYERLVNTIRTQIPARVPIRRSWVTAIEPDGDHQRVILSDGEAISARLVILASGLNWTLREALGMVRDLVSPCHSITLGFDLVPRAGEAFPFNALQYNPERAGDGMAYLTLFRMGEAMRANLFLYQTLKSPWIREFRSDPTETLERLLPSLRRIAGDYEVAGPIKVRPTDLHVMRNFEKAGIVLIGDAFATPCPATGTGTLKVFTDVDRLCNVHIPKWLATPGMGVEKIRAFYDDPVKRACDADSVARAHRLRALSVGQGLAWHARHWLRFVIRRVRWSIRSLLATGREPAAS